MKIYRMICDFMLTTYTFLMAAVYPFFVLNHYTEYDLRILIPVAMIEVGLSWYLLSDFDNVRAELFYNN